jgi:hypothetical protein
VSDIHSKQLNELTTPNTVSLIDLGFATHAVHMDQRLVQLKSFLSTDKKSLIVTGPPTAMIYPPGPAYLYVVTNAGVPSFGHKTLVGTGAAPPENAAALAKYVLCLCVPEHY